MKFRQRNLLGVIKQTKSSSRYQKIQPIDEIVAADWLHQADVERFEKIAASIFQAPSTVLYLAFRDLRDETKPLQFLPSKPSFATVKSDFAQRLEKVGQLLKNNSSVFIDLDELESAVFCSLARKKYPDQLLILAPRENLVTLIEKKSALGESVAILHGKTKATERAAIMRAWATGKLKTLIGTRQAALLPAQKLSAIILLDVSSEDYLQLERNPRFDSRNAAELLAQQHQAIQIHCGLLPRLTTIQNVPQVWSQETKPQLINLKAAEEQSGQAFLSETLIKAIEQALQNQKSVLLSFNRKGLIDRLECADCHHIPRCGNCGAIPIVREKDLICGVCETEMWQPEKCPACQSKKVKSRGLGNQHLKSELAKLFPQNSVGVIDKDHQENDCQISLVTEYYFKQDIFYSDQRTFGLIAEICADHALGGINYRSSEIAAYKLRRLQKIATQHQASYLVQTWLPEIIKPLLTPVKFLEQELELRKQYQLPPVVAVAKVDCKTTNQTEIIKLNEPANLELLKEKPDSCIIELDTPTYDSANSPPQS